MGNSAPNVASSPNVAAPSRRSSGASILLIIVALVFLCGYSLAHPLHDFVEYWTTAHLLIDGQNPYSIADVARIEHSLGFEQAMPLMMLSPPWALAFIAPLGVRRSYALVCFFWMVLLIAAVALSSRMLMDVYFGELRLPEISDTTFYRCLFAFTFFPVLLCLRFAQTAPLMLFGLAGFVYFESRGRDFIAGALLAVTLIKPHLVFLLWFAVALQSLRLREWRVIAGALTSLTTLTGVTLCFDVHIMRHYLALTRSPYIQAYAAGVGALLRKPFGGIGTLWIQLVPFVIGVVWFVRYWLKHRSRWSWRENLPLLLTVSVLTSAYGWAFDQTLLILPVVYLAATSAQIFGRIPSKLVMVYTALNCALILLWPLPTIGLLPAPIVLCFLLSRSQPGGPKFDAVAASA